MIDEYMPNKLLNNVKKITGIKEFDDAQILIVTHDKFPNDNILKNLVICCDIMA